MITRPRIFLTGANGFAGRYLIEALRGAFAGEVDLFAGRRSVGSVGSKEDGDVVWTDIDVRDRESVFRTVAAIQPTHVVHLAAVSHVPTSFRDPVSSWEINAIGTLNVLDAVMHGAPDAGVLYISTSEVYGGVFQQGRAVDESALLEPRNPYASSKAAADLMAGQYAAQGISVVRLRPFNHIGPGQSEDFVVSSFAAQIARIEKGLQEPVLSVGNLDAHRDFLDVRDVMSAYVLAIKNVKKLPSGLILNICSGIPRRIGDVLNTLLSQADCSIDVVLDKNRLRPSDTPMAVGLSDKAQQYLGWAPRIPWERTLGDVLDDWRHKIVVGADRPTR